MSKRIRWVGYAARIGELRKAQSRGFRKQCSHYTVSNESSKGDMYRSVMLSAALPHAQTIRPLSLRFLLNGLVFSFRPQRSSTCRNQEESTELSFTLVSHQQKNPITTERLQALLSAKNDPSAVFSFVRPTDRPTDRPTFVS